jgi:hypothetical protein
VVNERTIGEDIFNFDGEREFSGIKDRKYWEGKKLRGWGKEGVCRKGNECGVG